MSPVTSGVSVAVTSATPGGVEVAAFKLKLYIYDYVKRYIMSTYTQFLYQFVFGSKDHLPFLSEKNQDILFAYIAKILKNKSCHSYIVGGAVNHIHIITHLHPTVCPAYIIKDIKEASHSLIRREKALFPNFGGWQTGYSGFTYHISSKKALIKYVENQSEHHKKVSFKEELIRLLEENNVEYSEKYLLT